ncbi:MAG: SDR family oxidoreductase [Acidimicrobiia bacterium]|nr:SDR family oxidoreductase [Acidimicrobiia bacterium]
MADDDRTGTASERPVALVTGASAGIGEQFARYLGAGGHDIVLVARDRARLEALAKDLDADHGARAEVLAADLTDPDELERVESRLSSTDAPVDLLVNNAGFGTIGRFDRLPVDREVDEIELNVIAVVRLAHAAASAMVSRGHGAILNVSSIASRQPTPNMATYAATKAFVSSFSQSLHVELGGAGVHVMVLEPGFTRTEFQDRLGTGEEEGRVPEFLWTTPDTVVEGALADLRRGKAVSVPGWTNKVMAGSSSAMPAAVTRRVAAAMMKTD